MNDLRLLARVFADHFANWDIALSKTAVKRRTPGVIRKQGWLIQFCFGNDDRGEFLDYYAANRMTGDSHIRIRHDGSVEWLPAMSEFMILAPDEDEEKVRERYFAENQAVARLLFEKGFHYFTVNMALQSGMVDSKKPPDPDGEPGKKA